MHHGLQQILEQQMEPFKSSYKERLEFEEFEGMAIDAMSDSTRNPQISTVDPFGNDFFCGLCNQELGNVYLHCDGCEQILKKDFNSCVSCHKNKQQRQKDVQMHPLM